MIEKKVDVFVVRNILVEDDIFSIIVQASDHHNIKIVPIVTEKFVVPGGKQIKIKEIRIEYEIGNIPHKK